MTFWKRLYQVLFIEPRHTKKQAAEATLGKKSLAILVVQEGGR